MYSIEPLIPEDILNLNLVNLDKKTENYSFGYYLHYLLEHPEDCVKVKGYDFCINDLKDNSINNNDINNNSINNNDINNNDIISDDKKFDHEISIDGSPDFYKYHTYGYIIGKHEMNDNVLSAHVTALSVSSLFRNMGLGNTLMNYLEMNGNMKKAKFIDLFVRISNLPAISFYKKRGYVVFRVFNDYYQDPTEDAYDMRKSLEMDKEKIFMTKK
ncbi:N-terminal acetyltransferase B complex catalytic subunit naa20 [Dictyocoela muelleri]|nr:N-terminal acetyltransferase B complex catalytic subunit naa20 [Dictyocoela muelleri]